MNFRKHFQSKNLFNAIFIALILTFIGCDIIDEPYQKDIIIGPVDTTRPKILIDYFTAHKCINCPAGANRYKALQAQFPNKILVISIHGGSQAVPEPPDYLYDFRSPLSTELFMRYNAEAFGLPCGMVSRREHNGIRVMGFPA